MDAELIKKNIKFDRMPGETLSLPYSFYDVKVKPNDLVLADVINTSLERLYDNLLYIYSRSKISSNNIPSVHNYKYIIYDDGSLTYSDRSDFQTVSSSTTTSSILSSSSRLISINHELTTDNIFIFNDSTSVSYVSSSDVYTQELTGSNLSNTIGEISRNEFINESSDLKFANITDIKVNSNNDMYIIDNTYCTLYKYNITGVTRYDKAVLSRSKTPGSMLIDSIGSKGEASDDTRFNNPVLIAIDGSDNIFVLDFTISSGGTAKMFNVNGNWVKTIDLVDEFKLFPPKEVIYNSANDTFIVLTTNKYINIYNTSFERQSSTLIKDGGDSETLVKISLSKENTNILYILSNNNVYKKFLTNLSLTIGRFKIEDKEIGTGEPTDNNFTSIDIRLTTDPSTGENRDEIYIVDRNTGILHQFNEDSNFISVVYSIYKDSVFTFNELKVNSEEYVSADIYNKVLGKIVTNHLLFLEFIRSKFVIEYEYTGIANLIGTDYITADEINVDTYRPKYDNFIGLNEILLSGTINGALESIYNLQLEMLKIIKEKSTNSFPLDTQVISMDI